MLENCSVMSVKKNNC